VAPQAVPSEPKPYFLMMAGCEQTKPLVPKSFLISGFAATSVVFATLKTNRRKVGLNFGFRTFFGAGTRPSMLRRVTPPVLFGTTFLVWAMKLEIEYGRIPSGSFLMSFPLLCSVSVLTSAPT
jgi:hypothetical protein